MGEGTEPGMITGSRERMQGTEKVRVGPGYKEQSQGTLNRTRIQKTRTRCSLQRAETRDPHQTREKWYRHQEQGENSRIN